MADDYPLTQLRIRYDGLRGDLQQAHEQSAALAAALTRSSVVLAYAHACRFGREPEGSRLLERLADQIVDDRAALMLYHSQARVAQLEAALDEVGRPECEPTHIRGTHRYAFRSGDWARLVAAVEIRDRDCWLVEFPDGVVDWWPKNDPDAAYEFRCAE